MVDRIMPQRMVYGSAYNSMIPGLVAPHKQDMRPLAKGERYLGRFIVPPFQRGLVWTEYQKSRLIESIYIGLPIGAIVWNQVEFKADTGYNPCDFWLLDGRQRMSAICEYMAGQFLVMGWRYIDLPDREKVHFNRMCVPVIETCLKTEAECRDVYDRLVYGGSPHIGENPA